MWASEITKKSYAKGQFFVTVAFGNKSQSFEEDFDLTGGSVDVLAQKVQSRLDTLNATDEFESQVPLGLFVPILPTPDPEQIALGKLREIQQLVELGVIEKTDPQVTDAVTAAKAAIQDD